MAKIRSKLDQVHFFTFRKLFYEYGKARWHTKYNGFYANVGQFGISRNLYDWFVIVLVDKWEFASQFHLIALLNFGVTWSVHLLKSQGSFYCVWNMKWTDMKCLPNTNSWMNVANYCASLHFFCKYLSMFLCVILLLFKVLAYLASPC